MQKRPPFYGSCVTRGESTALFPADLSKLDNRVEAHLDGLRIAGKSGWEVMLESLPFDEPCDLFAAASIAFESGDQDWIGFVLRLVTKKTEVLSGVLSALGWLPYPQSRHIRTLLASTLPTRAQWA